MLGALGPDRRADFHLKSDAELFDPAVNARAACSISSHGSSFRPWSTYTNGMYRDHLGAARKAAQAGDAPPAGTVTATGTATASEELERPCRARPGRAGPALAPVRGLREPRRAHAPRAAPARRRHRARAAEAARPGPRHADLQRADRRRRADPARARRVRLQRQGAYAEKVRRLAEQADGGDGKWSRADARRFVKSIGPTTDPYERAVKEALLGGVIVRGGKLTGRRPPAPAGGRLPAQGVGGLTNGRVPPSRLSSVGDGREDDQGRGRGVPARWTPRRTRQGSTCG